jgi:serine/threonine protein kinase
MTMLDPQQEPKAPQSPQQQQQQQQQRHVPSAGKRAGVYAKQRMELAHSQSRLTRKKVPEFHESDLQLQERLGEGAFCQVYRATLQSPIDILEESSFNFQIRNNESYHSSTSTTGSCRSMSSSHSCGGPQPVTEYALKCLRPKTRCSEKIFKVAAADLALEGDILARLDHENLIRLHGRSRGCVSSSFDESNPTTSTTASSVDQLGYFLILDLLQQDTLKERLAYWRLTQNQPSKKQHGCHTKKTLVVPAGAAVIRRRASSAPILPTFSSHHQRHRHHHHTEVTSSMWSRIQTIAMGIALGMEYLHDQNVVLRDLKPENIGFCSTTGHVKLFDLGFAREEHLVDPYEIAGSLRYLSPENASRKPSGLPADVYSFGVLLWELCTLQLPFGQFHTVRQFQEKVQDQGWRPSLKAIPDKRLRMLIRRCWASDPTVRPTFRQVRIELEELLDSRPGSSSSSLTGGPASTNKNNNDKPWYRTLIRSVSWSSRNSNNNSSKRRLAKRIQHNDVSTATASTMVNEWDRA